MKKYLKYFLLIAIILFVVPQITLAAWWNPFSWGFWNNFFHRQTQTTQVVCTKEAKICPDGLTTVGRQGPKCEFAECPKLIGGDKDSHGCLAGAGYTWCEAKNKCLRVWEEKCDNTIDQTANWKTYTNVQYGFSIKYPSDLTQKIEKKGVRATTSFKNASQDIEPPFLSVASMPNQGGLTLEGWTNEEISQSKWIKQGSTKISGQTAYILILPESDAGTRYIFLSKDNGTIFDMNIQHFDEEIKNQILFNFNFAK